MQATTGLLPTEGLRKTESSFISHHLERVLHDTFRFCTLEFSVSISCLASRVRARATRSSAHEGDRSLTKNGCHSPFTMVNALEPKSKYAYMSPFPNSTGSQLISSVIPCQSEECRGPNASGHSFCAVSATAVKIPDMTLHRTNRRLTKTVQDRPAREREVNRRVGTTYSVAGTHEGDGRRGGGSRRSSFARCWQIPSTCSISLLSSSTGDLQENRGPVPSEEQPAAQQLNFS
eukprot:SAG31_NODE_4208_length_3473_cov_2.441612_1_plen_233_part_00